MDSNFVKQIAEWAAGAIELLGIGLMLLLVVLAFISAIIAILKKAPITKIYQKLRQDLGRGILLGLELLLAADIIHTVAVELNFKTVGVLSLIVLIRTFLSFSLEVELSGAWPWQKKQT